MAYGALDLVGVVLLAAGALPLIDGMPLFFFPATTDEALACVAIGLGLCVFAALKIVREVLRQARSEAAAG